MLYSICFEELSMVDVFSRSALMKKCHMFDNNIHHGNGIGLRGEKPVQNVKFEYLRQRLYIYNFLFI